MTVESDAALVGSMLPFKPTFIVVTVVTDQSKKSPTFHSPGLPIFNPDVGIDSAYLILPLPFLLSSSYLMGYGVRLR